MPRIRDYPEAGSLEPTDAFVIDREGVGTMFVEGDVFLVGAPYLFSWSNLGPILGDSEIMGGHVFALACSLPANMVGTTFAIDPSSLPAAEVTAIIYKVSAGSATSFGTMTIETDGSFSITSTATSFAISDLIEFRGPGTHDTNFSNMWMTGVATVGG